MHACRVALWRGSKRVATCKLRREAARRTQSFQHLDVGLKSSELLGHKCLLFKPASLVFRSGSCGRLTWLFGNALLSFYVFVNLPHFLPLLMCAFIPSWPENIPRMVVLFFWGGGGCLVVRYVGFPGESAPEKHIYSVAGGSCAQVCLDPVVSQCSSSLWFHYCASIWSFSPLF